MAEEMGQNQAWIDEQVETYSDLAKAYILDS